MPDLPNDICERWHRGSESHKLIVTGFAGSHKGKPVIYRVKLLCQEHFMAAQMQPESKVIELFSFPRTEQEIEDLRLILRQDVQYGQKRIWGPQAKHDLVNLGLLDATRMARCPEPFKSAEWHQI